MLDKLNAKKANLVAQRDQAVANLNAIVGAIALCDDLIAEAVTEQIAAKVAATEAEREAHVAEREAHVAGHGEGSPPAPEMPAVVKFEPCAYCDNPASCEDTGCGALVP